MTDEKKYTTNITLQNDSVIAVDGISGFYNPKKDAIYIRKGDIDLQKEGFKVPEAADENLVIIHERQHQLNQKQGAHTAVLNLSENYNRMCHDEITALIAEKLEIRRQYKASKTDEEREACLEKFAKHPEHTDYIRAIRNGVINPNSTSSKDFNEEMAFIKNSAIRYPYDDNYKDSWTQNSIIYLAQHGNDVKANPKGFEQSIRLMYENIGGIDFNKIGRQDLNVIENQSINAADKMLEQGASPKKLIRFMQQGEGDFKIAESLDVTGLNKEQAEKVMQTAIITQSLAGNIANDLVAGYDPSYDYDFVARNAQEKTAIYLDLKSDIWEKNGTLTTKGDEQKFNELMKKAKEFQLDTSQTLQSGIYSKKYDDDELSKRAQEMNGQTVSFDDVVKNQEGYKLPLDGTSKEDIIAKMDAKDEEDRKFWEDYYKKNPPKKPRVSDPYEVEMMDLSSNVLKDELAAREEAERKEEERKRKEEEERKRKEEEERKRKEEEERKRKEEEERRKEQQASTPEGTMPNNTSASTAASPDAPSVPDNGITIRPAPHAKTEITAPIATYVDDGKHIVTSTPKYDNAEIKTTTDENGQTTFSTILDGKKHGIEYTKDQNGNITGVSAYNQGTPLDLSHYSLELKTETRDDFTHNYALLNGYVFGTEITTDKDGNMTVAFYDDLGKRIEEKANTKITQTTENLLTQSNTSKRDATHNDIKEQKGSLPQNPTAIAQNLRFDWHWQDKQQENNAAWVPSWSQSAEKHGLINTPSEGNIPIPLRPQKEH